MIFELNRGDTFHLRNRIWKVTEVYKTQWNDGTRSVEYKIKSVDSSIKYLEIDFDKNENTSFSLWVKQSNKDVISSNQEITNDFITVYGTHYPKKMIFKGTTFEFEGKYEGIWSYNYESEKVISLDYESLDKKRLLSIELWEDEMEISTGFLTKEAEITQIKKSETPLNDSAFLSFLSNNIASVIGGAFFLIVILLSTCTEQSNNSRNNSNSAYDSDTSKIERSNNNYYRGRSSRSRGK